jgi:hypothetical protein
MLIVLPVTTQTFRDVFAIDLSSIDEITSNFTRNLNTRINELISNAPNESSNIVNSSNTMLSNGSNLTSSQMVVSNNRVSAVTSYNSAGDGSAIRNQITTINGVCTANTVGGAGNDTLASTGVCNDQLTGGLGADKFICGEGTDTVRDFSSEEGDIILDPQNCETTI